MSTEGHAGETPAIPEDTLDLGDRLDPVRTLLRRAAGGDQRAARALVDVLGPRIHGLGVHITGSTAKAGRLTVWVLRSCLRDAGQLAASGLPGEAAVLDRARRAAVATEPSGDVRSLVAPDAVSDRTRDRREVTVMRALLDLPARERALVESAAQGRFPYTGTARQQPAMVLARLLDSLVPFGQPGGGAGTDGTGVERGALAALDALALADDGERARLRALTAGTEAAGAHRHAIEAAAQLTLLTAMAPSRDLHEAVLEGFGASGAGHTPAPGQTHSPGRTPAPGHAAPPASRQPEAAYHGTYATPVLGTDTQRRLVGPPAMTGGMPSGIPAQASAPLSAPAPPPQADSGTGPGSSRRVPGAAPAPAFAFSPRDEAELSRRRRRQAKARGRAERDRERSPWPTRILAVVSTLLLIGALVASGLLLDARRDLAETRAFAATWSELSVQEDARPVPGLSDNGTWRAIIAENRAALWAEGVSEYEPDGDQEEVLQLWGERDGVPVDLGVLDVPRDGTIQVVVPERVDRLHITREHAPQNRSGTPSERVVANLDPELSGT